MFSFSRFRLFAGGYSTTQINVRKNSSRLFCTTESSLTPKLPIVLERFIGDNEVAKKHYFTYLTHVERATVEYNKKRYPDALQDLQKARYELEETTDLGNMTPMTMSLFNNLDKLEKEVQAQIPNYQPSHTPSFE